MSDDGLMAAAREIMRLARSGDLVSIQACVRTVDGARGLFAGDVSLADHLDDVYDMAEGLVEAINEDEGEVANAAVRSRGN